ncbi:MAG: hypothetical protein ACRCVN_03855 [Spirochaetia bacterium]
MLSELQESPCHIPINFAQEISGVGLPRWTSGVHKFFHYPHKVVEIERRGWSAYIAQKVYRARHRIFFHLDWPFVPQKMRSQVLLALQNCFLKGVRVDAYFRSIHTPRGGWPLFLHLDNTKNINKIDTHIHQYKDLFSFLVIDQFLLLQAPSKSYHHHLIFFEISSIPENQIHHIFSHFFKK